MKRYNSLWDNLLRIYSRVPGDTQNTNIICQRDNHITSDLSMGIPKTWGYPNCRDTDTFKTFAKINLNYQSNMQYINTGPSGALFAFNLHV